MKEELINLVRPCHEPRIDTAKRVAGAIAMLAVTMPVPNKLGLTVPNALRMTDILGAHLRHYADKVTDKTEAPADYVDVQSISIAETNLD